MNRAYPDVPLHLMLAIPLALTPLADAMAAAGDLTVQTVLASEDGTTTGEAEGNERLTYAITITNASAEEQIVDVTETIPDGTSYGRGDDFLHTCTGDGQAGDTCVVGNLAIPANGSSTIYFSAKVADPITTASINNSVSVTGIDCGAAGNDCNEYLATAGVGQSSGFSPIHPVDWDETRVRKVLHAFAYGGHATDAQITAWADMTPEAAVAEMLTFSYTNARLSPAEDASAMHAHSLESLQEFWSDPDDSTNPMRQSKREFYETTGDYYDGKRVLLGTMQNAWSQAVTTRGINPFLHKVTFFLTNYHMAVRASLATPGVFRSYYDEVSANLVAGKSMTEVIAEASKSAAVALRYKHHRNKYNQSKGTFLVNDDFAREYFQLFFRYLPTSEEDHIYHEETNIERNAELLTGMLPDKVTTGHYGVVPPDTIAPIHQWIGRIDFESSVNQGSHYTDCLEIFRTPICGSNAALKIDQLSAVMKEQPEVMAALPVYIIEHLADDTLDDNEQAKIRASWAQSGDDLLTFLRDYAISTTFHSKATVKYRTAFDRNAEINNAVIASNAETFVGRPVGETPKADMAVQGAEIFNPIHDVFGGQTGLEAANNLAVFKDAYDKAATYPTTRIGRWDAKENDIIVWEKDWRAIAPRTNGQFVVSDVADWLWQRITGDGGKNFDAIARAQVLSLLATGNDLGYALTRVDPGRFSDPNAEYSSADINNESGDTGPLKDIVDGFAAATVALDHPTIAQRKNANRNISRAALFIATLPYTFALEGK